MDEGYGLSHGSGGDNSADSESLSLDAKQSINLEGGLRCSYGFNDVVSSKKDHAYFAIPQTPPLQLHTPITCNIIGAASSVSL